MSRDTRTILEEVRSGVLTTEEALLELKQKPFTDIGYAKVDVHRRIRQGSASHALSWIRTIWNCIRLIWQYTRIYFRGKDYLFSFYSTRVLAALHTIIAYE